MPYEIDAAHLMDCLKLLYYLLRLSLLELMELLRQVSVLLRNMLELTN